MKSLSAMERIIFRTLIIAFLTIGAWKNAPRAEATIAPRHYPIQVLRRTDGRVARSLLNQMTSTNWLGTWRLLSGQGKPTLQRKAPG